jgi:interferon gamma inducible protein 47
MAFEQSTELERSVPKEVSISKLAEICKIKGEKACDEFISKKLEKWKTVEVKIGVMGRVKSGKSSFINAVIGLKPNDVGAAKVSVLQTTKAVEAYNFPENKLIKLYDIPGMGTKNFPRNTYLQTIDYKRFDVCIIVTNGVYSEDEMFLAQQLNNYYTTFFYVRTFIAQDIENDDKDNPNRNQEEKMKKQEELIESVKKGILEDIPPGSSSELYIIDNRCPLEYDFPILKKRILNSLKSKKREALLYSLNASDKIILDEKIKQLQTRIFWLSALSGICGIVPIYKSKIDLKIIRDNSQFFIQQLGLMKETLETLAKLSKTPFEDLDKIVQPPNDPSAIYGFVDDDNILKTMIEKLNLNTDDIVKIDSWLLNMPIYATYAGSRMIYKILDAILSKMKTSAIEVLYRAGKTLANKQKDN